MKKLIKMLPLMALVLAAVVAFAFSNPAPVSGQLFANDNNTWRPIPDEEPGSSYDCDGVEGICTAKFLNDDPSNMANIIPESVTPGLYVEP